MYRHALMTFAALVAFTPFTLPSASAALIVYNDRASWEAAAGTPTISEDFSGLVANQNLGTLLDVGPFTLQAFELDGPESGANATTDSVLFAVDSANNPETVVMIWDQAITAIALDFFTTNTNGVGRQVDVTTSDGMTSYFLPDPVGTAFVGITFMAPVTQLTWSSPSGGAGHFITNVDAVVIPEPATMTLLGLGLAGFALRRRNMKA